MDPISITASLLTLVGAAGRVGQGARCLWDLRQAPAMLALLDEEISDLQALLDFVKHVALTTQGDCNPNGNPLVLCALRQGTSAIQKLHALVQIHLTRMGTEKEKKVRYRGFLKSDRLLQARKDVEKAKYELGIALAALAFSQQYHMSNNATLNINSNFIELQAQKNKPIQYPLGRRDRMNTNYNNGGVSSPQRFNAAISINGSVNQCHQCCPCVCHIRGNGGTPGWLQFIFGILSYRYSIVPAYFRRLCDLDACTSNGGSVELEYRLPPYAFAYIIYIYVTWSAAAGIRGNWNLRPSEYVPRGIKAVYDILDPSQTPRQLEMFLDTYKISARAINPDDGFSLLYSAMVRNQWDMVELLLSRGADLHYREPTSAGITPAQYAWTVVLGSQPSFHLPKTILQLLDESDTLELMQFGQAHGIITGLLSLDLESQLDLTPDLVEDVDFNGRTPLFWSVRRADSRLTSVLIARGANVNHRDLYGNTPLHFATLNSGSQCANMLIMAGASMNVLGGISGIRLTPLTAAALAGSTASAVMLLESGADPNFGELPPLFAAAFMGNMEIERYLRRYGACIDGRFAQGHATVMRATTDLTPKHLDSLQNMGMRLDLGGHKMTNLAVGSGNILASKMMCLARPGELPMTRKDGDKYWSAFLHLRDSYRFERS